MKMKTFDELSHSAQAFVLHLMEEIRTERLAMADALAAAIGGDVPFDHKPADDPEARKTRLIAEMKDLFESPELQDMISNFLSVRPFRRQSDEEIAEEVAMENAYHLKRNRDLYREDLTDIAKFLFRAALDDNEHVTHDELINQAATFLEKIKQKSLEVVI